MKKHYLAVSHGVWIFSPGGALVDVEHIPSGEQFDGEPDYHATVSLDAAREKYKDLKKKARKAWSRG